MSIIRRVANASPLRTVAGMAVVLVAGVLAVGLQTSGLALYQDDHVEITSPRPLSVVSPPLTIDWTVYDDLAHMVAGREAFFAVFIDRSPVAPGQSLAALADEQCLRDEECPNREWLAQRRVLVTDRSEVELASLPSSGGEGRAAGRSLHRVTIVPMHADGHRLGEHAYTVEFLTEAHDEGGGR